MYARTHYVLLCMHAHITFYYVCTHTLRFTFRTTDLHTLRFTFRTTDLHTLRFTFRTTDLHTLRFTFRTAYLPYKRCEPLHIWSILKTTTGITLHVWVDRVTLKLWRLGSIRKTLTFKHACSNMHDLDFDRTRSSHWTCGQGHR